MSNQEIEPRGFILTRIVEACENKGIQADGIDDGFDLFSTGAFDSLGFVSLVTSIEDQFGIELDFSELDPEAFTTLGGLASVVSAATTRDS